MTPFPSALRSLIRSVLWAEFRRSHRLFQAARAITAVSETYLRWALARASRALSADDGCFPLGCPDPGGNGSMDREKALIRERLGIPQSRTVISFVGTFGASYDVTTVVRAARLLAESGREAVHFVLAGDGQQMAEARRLADGLPNVVLPGWLNQAEVRSLNATAAVGLCAYSPKALQSIPYKPMEYLAAGLPLLSSLRGEMAEILEQDHCGISYRAGDGASLVDGIQWYLDRPDERVSMSARARALFLRRFDAAVIYPLLASRLETLAGRHADS